MRCWSLFSFDTSVKNSALKSKLKNASFGSAGAGESNLWADKEDLSTTDIIEETHDGRRLDLKEMAIKRF